MRNNAENIKNAQKKSSGINSGVSQRRKNKRRFFEFNKDTSRSWAIGLGFLAWCCFSVFGNLSFGNNGRMKSFYPARSRVGGAVSASEFWEPYGTNTLKVLEGSSVLTQSRDPYWLKQGVIADGLYMSNKFTTERRAVALKTMRALYDAITWWRKNLTEGNRIIADGMKGRDISSKEELIAMDGYLECEQQIVALMRHEAGAGV